MLTGVEYDIVNQALAEHRLQKLEAKLRRDAERGDISRRGLRRPSDRQRQVSHRDRRMVDPVELARIPLLLPDPDRCRVARRHRSGHPPDASSLPPAVFPDAGPMAAAPTITITIVNAEPAGAGVAFAIDGVAYQAAAGSRQDLAVAPDSHITYDGGGSLGQRRYRLSPGLYEFRSTAEGWALYKLADMP